ncbi:hypothetical protein BJV78DRAFT_1158500 [Lactifluus subvellereus]|nr:hypothetical protein BJV78DRAFT_1158500 [Lactifluus subvellereus]
MYDWALQLMNVGLLYTPVSIYQMTRGALVLFVGVFSVLFLHRGLYVYQWLSLLTVMAGVSLVGFSGSLIKDTLQPVAPSLIFTAAQFVIEEKILGQYTVPPLLAVGYEGLFGAITIIILLPFLSLIKPPASSPAAAWFDLVRGWHQLIDTPSVLYTEVTLPGPWHDICNRCSCTGEPLIIWHAIKEIARRHVDVQHWPAVPTEPKNGEGGRIIVPTQLEQDFSKPGLNIPADILPMLSLPVVVVVGLKVPLVMSGRRKTLGRKKSEWPNITQAASDTTGTKVNSRSTLGQLEGPGEDSVANGARLSKSRDV